MNWLFIPYYVDFSSTLDIYCTIEIVILCCKCCKYFLSVVTILVYKIRKSLLFPNFLFQNFPFIFEHLFFLMKFLSDLKSCWKFGGKYFLYRLICREFTLYNVAFSQTIHSSFILWHYLVFCLCSFFKFLSGLLLDFFKNQFLCCYCRLNIFFEYTFWLNIFNL